MTKSRACVWLMGLLLVAMPAGAVPKPGPAKPAPAKPHPTGRLPWNASLPVRWDVAAAANGHGLVVLYVGPGTVRYPCSSVAQAQREAPRLAARMALLSVTRGTLAEVSAGRCEDGPCVIWRGRVVLTASSGQARDLGVSSADALVAAWVGALRAAAATTSLPSSMPREVAVAVGESRAVALPSGWAGAAIDNPSAATVSVTASGPLVTVGGRAPGISVLRLRKGDHEASLEVRVLDRAGQLPQQAAARISGTQPDAAFLADAVERAIEQASRPVSGAELNVYVQSGRPTIGGTSRVTAWLEGPGLWPVASSVTVAVQPTDAVFTEPAQLAASNDPERIDRDGFLVDTPLGNGNNVFYFHHQNAPSAPPRVLSVRIQNLSTVPSDVLIMESGAGPSKDELYAGHLATWRYMGWMARGNGLRLRLGPRESCVLDERVLGARDVACGVGQVMVLSGPPPHFIVDATSTGPTEHFAATEQIDTTAPRPAANVIRGRGLFDSPIRNLFATYVVGGPYAFVPIGGPPYQNPLGEGSVNSGNYGVDHRVHIKLSNPTAEEKKVYVVFAVGGGVARGSLLVDGQLVQTPLLRNAVGKLRECPLVDVTLHPGEERTVEIRTLPEMGSNYPVRIIAKPFPANM